METFLPIEEIAAHTQTQVDRLQAQVVELEKYVNKFTESSVKRIEDALAEVNKVHTAERQKTSENAAQAAQAIHREADTIQKALHELRLALGSIAIVEGRIEDLHNVCFGTREDMHKLAGRINDNAEELHQKHADHSTDVQQYVDKRIDALAKWVFERVSAQIVEEVTPQVIAQALVKHILITRPANSYELKDGTALAVRQATVEEVRAGKPHGV